MYMSKNNLQITIYYYNTAVCFFRMHLARSDEARRTNENEWRASRVARIHLMVALLSLPVNQMNQKHHQSKQLRS